MDCFVQDDDGNGTLRGELVGNIQRCLERRDADYQTRWNRVWASALCKSTAARSPKTTGCGRERF